MVGTGHLESARTKVERSKQHAIELNQCEQEFLGRQPFVDVLEFDRKIGANVRKIRFTERVPVAYSAIASDGFNNLRDALDHALFSVAVMGGKATPRHCSFPFSATEAGFENALKGRSKDLPPSFFPFLRQQKPFRGGNDKLWILNQLANSSKHTLLRPMVVSTGSFSLNIERAKGGFIGIPGDALQITQAGNEFVILHQSPDMLANYKFEVQMFLSLSKPDLARGERAVRVMDVLTHDVAVLLDGIEQWIADESPSVGHAG